MQIGFPTPVSAGHLISTNHIRQLAALLGEPESRGTADAQALQSVLMRATALVSAMLRQEMRPELKPPSAPRHACAGLAPWQQRRVRELVEERIQEKLSVVEMAAAARLSRSFFSRAFSVSFGLSPHAYVMERRIARAKTLMQDTDEPLAQVAVACGLSDQAHLSRLFRRQAGTTPSAWRRRVQAARPNTPSRAILEGNVALGVG